MNNDVVKLHFTPGNVTLGELRTVYTNKVIISVPDSVWVSVAKGNKAVNDILKQKEPVYGINTGFGLLAQTRIPDHKLAELQRNLVLSHSAGVGSLIEKPIVRLIIFLKIISLSQGHSGVRREVIELLIALINHDITPCIPSKGSVGASGDLAPLAHLAMCLIGENEVIYKGAVVSSRFALEDCKLGALVLGPKEGLALLNGTQASSALTLSALFDTENLFSAAITTGALSVDAMKGSTVPFDARIHQSRRQPGQITTAVKYLELLLDSEIRESHINCDKVQDPYSLRCQPQVMGACLDLIRNVAKTLELEANAVTDNPLIFPETLEALSGGNFHAEPIAFAADTLALAVSEIASISERRISLLVDPNMNAGLPAFLVKDSGLNSGFMIAQVTAAALVSENKTLAHPASVDSIPTSANQEDHVSMATFAARRLHDMIENSINVLAIELLASAQAIDFHRPHETSPKLKPVVEHLRAKVPNYDKDRFFAPDIVNASELISTGYFYPIVSDILPSGGI